MTRWRSGVVAGAWLLAACAGAAQPDTNQLRTQLQAYADSLDAAASFPGFTIGVALPDGRSLSIAAGEADTALDVRMRPDARLLQGSVGKTYVAATALQLASTGALDLDAPISRYLGDAPWWQDASGRVRLPNGANITVRMLMNHTSGVVRYELQEAFTRDLTRQPDRTWTVADRVSYVLDSEAPFAAGDGWEYSDTNYILLGAIIEKITGNELNDEIRRRFLEPLGLRNTVPSVSRTVPGLVQGYAGPGNPFGGSDAMIVNGRFAVNPQFEWAGGGYASTSEDLARWAKAMYEGRAFDAAMLQPMLQGIEAPMLGRGASYGLGVILRDTPLGMSWGHSGFMPGYLTEMRYFPDHRFAVAVQFNTSVGRSIGRAPGAVLQDVAAMVAANLAAQQ